jgi:AraC family ethanolamine operon transcriptional activator
LINTIEKFKEAYHDLNAYSRSFRIGLPEHNQLEPGEFQGEICQVVSENVIVCTLRSNRTLLETGSALSGFTIFLLPGNMQQEFSWRTQRLTGQRIGILKSQMPHSAVIPSNFFGTPIAIRNDFLKKLIIDLSFDSTLYQLIQKTEVVELPIDEALKIQKMIIELCSSDDPDERTLTEELPVALLMSLEKLSGQLPGKLSSSRDLTFSYTIKYIQENLNQRITTKSLTDNLEISERSLRYMFNELTGLAPMSFIKALKLNKVRRELIGPGPETKINTITAKWGFNHSGQFAKDYKKLFGELPKETLRREQGIYQVKNPG